MKTMKLCFSGAFLLFLITGFCNAQEAEPMLLSVTTMHWNEDMKDFKRDEWLKMEKEYMDKVINKNEHILATNVMTHYFTEDNTEIMFITLYKDWDGMKKAKDRNAELEKAAWPDKTARENYFDKAEAYYDSEHSDELYSAYPAMKELAATPTKPMLYYVKVHEKKRTKDGTPADFNALNKQWMDAVVNKNEFIKAYYTYGHAWGSNSNDYVEVFVLDSLNDVEKMFDREEALYKEHWKDEGKRKDYEGKIDRYFTGKHGDYLYMSVPELIKTGAHSPAKK